MSMTKNQTAAAVAIGCFVVAAGVLGWFLYDAIDARGEQEGELESQLSEFRRYNDAPVFPSQKTIALVNTNKAELAAWRATAREYAARGDRTLAAETPPIFKQRLDESVRRMCSFRGSAAGHLAAAGFKFGFDAYLGDGGILPDVNDVPRLAAQLDDIEYIVTNLVAAGVLEVRDVRRIEPAPEGGAKKDGGSAKKKKKKKDGGAAKKDGGSAPEPASLEYEFTFIVRPDAFVKSINALSSGERFLVVKNLAFRETADDIENNMTAATTVKSGVQQSGGRRNRGHAAPPPPASAAAVSRDAAKAVTVVCDPESGSPIQVDMTIASWNFSSKAM